MKTTFAVLAFATAALAAGGPPAQEYTDGQPQVPTAYGTSSTAAPVTTSAVPVTSSVVAPVSTSILNSTVPAPYPVPGGNTTLAATGTGAQTTLISPTTRATTTAGAAGTSGSPSAPAPSAAAPTNAAAALQIGGAAALAGLLAFFA
ncbi:hypothetical protein LTR09_000734 [Extremus antarcticus]|uniref:Uncharacterized protein n=1 Tax=Extremus antarcticus TaxID=702011 RepID=A0AAJ0GKD5_9PEZI|nr:hypothetical protein LTR09_000734 [Extremus antarcticus]